jgi:mxaA protein
MKHIQIKKQMAKMNPSNTLLPSLLAICLVLNSSAPFAKEAETTIEKASTAKIISVINPNAGYGVHIGDRLSREVVLEVPRPFEIVTFPKKGSKYDGVELVDVNIKSEQQKMHTLYTVNLSYQAFVSTVAPSVMQLPPEKFALTKGSNPDSIEILPWHFWFAPLVTGGLGVAQKNIQPEFKPPLVEIKPHQIRLYIALSMLIASLLALLYINADRQWLPFMGGAFAKAHRQLKRLSKKAGVKTAADEKQALVYIHQAFNQHYGANIFPRDIGHFLTLRPSFRKMKDRIEQFFNASNQALYATEPRNSAEVIENLVQLSKQLRDCERGV